MIRELVETGSTNADMLEWAAHGARELDWIVAERQTEGRGRIGRDWQSPPGNLYASTLIRLRDGDPPAATLALVSAIAVHHTIKSLIWPPQTGDEWSGVRIKWPNDVLHEGRKLSGILLERAGNAVVIGIGINLLWSPSDTERLSTSIAEIGTDLLITPHSALELLREYTFSFLQRWRSPEQGGLPWVCETWMKCAHPIGTRLCARLGSGEELDGLFDGLDINGALRLRLASGEVQVIHAGDVFTL